MFSIEDYLSGFSAALRGAFAERLLYIGLQGSYSRGEADEKSDIDVMVVLDTLSVSDLDRYRSIVEQTGEAARSCGFLCGREELSKWNPCEILSSPPYDRGLVRKPFGARAVLYGRGRPDFCQNQPWKFVSRALSWICPCTERGILRCSSGRL